MCCLHIHGRCLDLAYFRLFTPNKNVSLTCTVDAHQRSFGLPERKSGNICGYSVYMYVEASAKRWKKPFPELCNPEESSELGYIRSGPKTVARVKIEAMPRHTALDPLSSSPCSIWWYLYCVVSVRIISHHCVRAGESTVCVCGGKGGGEGIGPTVATKM